MKYYSEITKKMYDSVKELENAEKEVSDKNNARKEDAAKVEKAYKDWMAARENYSKVLIDFCAKYGAYHTTVKAENTVDSWKNLSALIDLMGL